MLKNSKRRVNFILRKKLKYYTKEIFKYFKITMLAFSIIITMVSAKYKPVYKVSISGKELGYVENKKALEEEVKESVIEKADKKC